MNNVILTGRISKELELKGANTQYVNFGLAVQNGYTKQVDFFDVTVFNQGAKFLAEYAQKGDLILVRGRLAQDVWTDKDGEKHSKVQVLATEVELLRKKKAQNEEEFGF